MKFEHKKQATLILLKMCVPGETVTANPTFIAPVFVFLNYYGAP
jgi:hypothetical protein